MRLSYLAAAAMALVAPAAVQAATTVTFNGVCSATQTLTQAACSSSTNGAYGNTATIAGTNDATLVMKISAWQSNQTTGAITTAFLGAYSGGFGVTGVQDSNGGNNLHQIDNVNGYTDFVVLQFSRAVHLEGINLNLYQITGVSGMDSDASIYNASALTPAVWNTTVNAALLTTNNLYNASNQYEVAGTSTAGTRGPAANALAASNAAGTTYSSQFSKVWLVGASSLVADKNDGFKLAQIMVTSAQPAVPEPATWAMMIVGFGAIGGSLRRRARASTAVRLTA